MGREANAGIPPYTHFIPKILPGGDSITVGGEDTVHAGWRWTFWNLAVGSNIDFVGTQSWAGNDGGLASDPQHEGRNNATVAIITPILVGDLGTFKPDMVIALIGTNDAANGDSGATIAAAISDMWDQLWASRPSPWFQIVGCTIPKRYDEFDTAVQACNALLPAIAAGKSYASHLTLVDCYDFAGGPGGMFDLVHPNTAGHINGGTIIYNGCLTALGRIVTPWPPT